LEFTPQAHFVLARRVVQTPSLGLRFLNRFLAPAQAIAATAEKPQIAQARRGLPSTDVPAAERVRSKAFDFIRAGY
jgi:hypothetical protein